MIIPGILEMTLTKLEEKLLQVDGACEVIQIDIADGKKVEGTSFLEVEKICQINHKTPLELHFMVENPLKYFPVDKGKIDGVSKVCTQVIKNTQEVLIKLKEIGYLVGVSLNSDEEMDTVEQLLDIVDYVQFMGVVPGKQGSPFIPEVLEKIKDFKTKHPNLITQIDGGVNKATLSQVQKSGVDNIVIGSAIFNSEDPKKKLLKFSETAHGRTYNFK